MQEEKEDTVRGTGEENERNITQIIKKKKNGRKKKTKTKDIMRSGF
jgi:hypothetical protein